MMKVTRLKVIVILVLCALTSVSVSKGKLPTKFHFNFKFGIKELLNKELFTDYQPFYIIKKCVTEKISKCSFNRLYSPPSNGSEDNTL